METKELKIQVPEGYEIDKENSTFECIKFKSTKKNIAYKEICKNLFSKDKFGFYITDGGGIYGGMLNATNSKQLKRILALNRLLNITEYYNAKTKKDEWAYSIAYDKYTSRYYVEKLNIQDNTFLGVIATFYNIEDAQAVIGNPNFREILDIIYKFK